MNTQNHGSESAHDDASYSYEDPEMLTVEQGARRMNVGLSTMHKWCKREPGVIRVSPGPGRRALVRIPVEVLNRMIRRNTVVR